MPKLNAYWTKYGCEKCNDYDCISMVVNFSDSKSAFQSWITTNKMTCPGVCKDEGGSDFIKAVAYNAGGPTYLINPDKTWKRTTNYASETDLTSAGLKAHVCGTPITQELTNKKINSNVALYNVSKDGFAVNVQTEGTYSIAFYSANGQLKSMVSKKHFSTGSHKVNLELNNGFYLVEINNGDNIIREKVMVK